MAATTVSTFIDALVALLGIRAGLAGVNIFGAPVPPDALGKKSIELADVVEVEQEQAAMSSSHIAEEYGVKGSILIVVPMAAGVSRPATINTAAAAARTQALAVYEEVADALAGDQTVSSSVLGAAAGGMRLEQGFTTEGRTCYIEFTIDVEAHATP